MTQTPISPQRAKELCKQVREEQEILEVMITLVVYLSQFVGYWFCLIGYVWFLSLFG
jgi:hypothetical protein